MAGPSSSPDRNKIHQAVVLAYRCASDGASSDAVLCSDEKRSRFDAYVRTFGEIYGFCIPPEEARRMLLGLRKAGLLGPTLAPDAGEAPRQMTAKTSVEAHHTSAPQTPEKTSSSSRPSSRATAKRARALDALERLFGVAGTRPIQA